MSADDGITTLPATHGIYRGDSWGHTIAMTTDGTTPFDLTDYTARSQMRRYFADIEVEPVFDCTVEVDTPTNGTIVVNLLPAQTAAITSNRMAWDVELTNDGLVWTPVRYWVPVVGDVTKEAA